MASRSKGFFSGISQNILRLCVRHFWTKCILMLLQMAFQGWWHCVLVHWLLTPETFLYVFPSILLCLTHRRYKPKSTFGCLYFKGFCSMWGFSCTVMKRRLSSTVLWKYVLFIFIPNMQSSVTAVLNYRFNISRNNCACQTAEKIILTNPNVWKHT